LWKSSTTFWNSARPWVLGGKDGITTRNVPVASAGGTPSVLLSITPLPQLPTTTARAAASMVSPTPRLTGELLRCLFRPGRGDQTITPSAAKVWERAFLVNTS
jgi:hypothetical protein